MFPSVKEFLFCWNSNQLKKSAFANKIQVAINFKFCIAEPENVTYLIVMLLTKNGKYATLSEKLTNELYGK